MIISFACKETEKIWNGQASRRFASDLQNRALQKMRLLDAARRFEDLRNPPGNHLEVLRGDREGQMSIRINNQWRLCFTWICDEATNVAIVDYH